MSPSTPTQTGAPADRTPVQFDARTGDLRIGPHERHVDDPRQPEQVYGAYLSLLYAVRRARPGERLALRSADLEALLLLVGDDPATIESRLVDLMGCTPAEAGVLGRLLLRQRRTTATLGIAALSLAGVGLASQLTGEESAPGVAERSAPVAAAPSATEPLVLAPGPVVPELTAPAAAEAAVAPATEPAVEPQVEVEPPVVRVGPAVVHRHVSQPVVVAAPAPERPVGPQAPAAAAPAGAPAAPAPVEVAPEDRYTPPLVEERVWDVPPPVDAPEAGIGEAVSETAPLQPISGTTDSGHPAPVGPGRGTPGRGHPEPVTPVEPISGTTDSGHDVPAEAPAPAVEQGAAPAEPAAEAVPGDLEG